MTGTRLQLPEASALGRTFRVDTASVWAEVADHDRLTRISIGSLIAFQGETASEYLIGVLDRVTRDQQESPMLDDVGDDEEVPVVLQQRDLIRVVLVGTYRTVDGSRSDTFKRGADSYPRVDSLCWVIEAVNLQRLMGILTAQVPEAERLQLGHFVADPSASAVADGNRLFQRHAALLGSTGAGKSWSVALILERAQALTHANLVVLDMHGEYTPLDLRLGGFARHFRVAGPTDVDTSDKEAMFLPVWLLNQDEMQALLLDRSEESAPNQAARLAFHVRALKGEALQASGRTELLSQFTVDSPLPFDVHELISRLQADDREMVQGANSREKQGPFYGKLTRFITRLQTRMQDRRYAFMFQPPSDHDAYDWLHQFAVRLLGTDPGIKVVDFSEVPSDVLPVTVGLLARVLYEVHFWVAEDVRTPVTLVCDEAHLYVPSDAADQSESRSQDIFERIAKEGRKYGVSLLVVSQRPADVSKTVLSQCNNFIVLRLTNDRDQTTVRRLIPDNLDTLTASLPLLDVGEALLLGDAIVLPTRIKLDQPTIKPASATLDFWTQWSTRAATTESLVAGVEAMRRQSRRNT